MIKKYLNLKTILISLLIIIETILYIRILFIKGDTPTRYFDYISIVVAFVFAISQINKKELHFEIGALLFTLLADTCLVLLRPQHRLLALIFFNITQILHMLYVNKALDKKIKNISYIVRIILSIILVTLCLIVLGDTVDAVSLLTMVYFANLVCNLIFAFFDFKNKKIFIFGLIFFIGCDIFVGMEDLFYSYIEISHSSLIYRIFNSDFDFIWFFYLPSQTLLAINIINKKSERILNKKIISK